MSLILFSPSLFYFIYLFKNVETFTKSSQNSRLRFTSNSIWFIGLYLVYIHIPYLWYIVIHTASARSFFLTDIFRPVAHLLLNGTPDSTVQAGSFFLKTRYNSLLVGLIHCYVVVLIIIASFFWIMALLSYARVLFTSPGKPPDVNLYPFDLTSFPKILDFFHPLQARTPLLSTEESGSIPLNLPRYYFSPKLFNWQTMNCRHIDAQDKADIMPVISTSRQDGQPKYCHMCECYKPERAHHCKECNECVLKMDQ